MSSYGGGHRVMARGAPDFVLLAGNSHKQLALEISSRLGVKLASSSLYKATNGETVLDIGDSVRGRDVYIIQTGGAKDVNNNIMELLIMAYACRTSSARNIVGVIPYLPYGKQSKMRKRGCIVAKLLAKMISKAGLTHVITMDIHQKEVQGFFDCPVDNLRASPFLLQYIQEQIPDYRNAVIVAKDAGSAKKATSYAERLRLGIAVLHGEQKESENDEVDGRYSPPPEDENNGVEGDGSIASGGAVGGMSANQVQSSSGGTVASGSCSSGAESFHLKTLDVGLDEMPVHPAKNKPPMTVVGDVGGRIAIMVDDMIDDLSTFIAAAEVLRDRGAYKIYLLATHGVFAQDAPRLIEESPINEVVVTNTVPHEVQKMQCSKIKTIDISILLAEAIRRIHYKESMSYLFRNVTLAD